jgi:hypothetical protein
MMAVSNVIDVLGSNAWLNIAEIRTWRLPLSREGVSESSSFLSCPRGNGSTARAERGAQVFLGARTLARDDLRPTTRTAHTSTAKATSAPLGCTLTTKAQTRKTRL